MKRILIVDDDKDLRFNLSCILKEEGYEVIVAADGKQALNAIAENVPDLVLLDIKLPGMDGVELLGEMKKIEKNLSIIMLTAYSDVKSAVNAMKLGAFDYISKPFDNEELILIIGRVFHTQYLGKEVEKLKKRLDEKIVYELIGESHQTKQILSQIQTIASTKMTVILEGESGTGKEIVAHMIHLKSLRKEKPFVAIDCGAIPESLFESELFGYEKGAFTGAEYVKEGRFEQADGGTLFLDEVTNLTLPIQMKLLRVIHERRIQRLSSKKDIDIDVRIIAATNINIEQAVKEGKFRDDLYFRLNEFRIELPPLRVRKDDIKILAEYFLEDANREFDKAVKGFSDNAVEFLLNYNWPGNIRELRNVTKRAVLLAKSELIDVEHFSLNPNVRDSDVKTNIVGSLKATSGATLLSGLSSSTMMGLEDINKGASLKEITSKATKQIERDIITQILTKVDGNKAKAAKILKIDRMTLYTKMKEFMTRS